MAMSKGAVLLCLITTCCTLASSFNEVSNKRCETTLQSVRVEVTSLMLHAICHDNSSVSLVIKNGINVRSERIMGFCRSFDFNTGEAVLNQPLASSSVLLQLVKSGILLDTARAEIITSHQLFHYRISVWGNHTRFIIVLARECSRKPNYDFNVAGNDIKQTYPDQASQNVPVTHMRNRTTDLSFPLAPSNGELNFIPDKIIDIPEHIRHNNLQRNVGKNKVTSKYTFLSSSKSQIDENDSQSRNWTALSDLVKSEPTIWTALLSDISNPNHLWGTRKRRAEKGDIIIGNETSEISASGSMNSFQDSLAAEVSAPTLLTYDTSQFISENTVYRSDASTLQNVHSFTDIVDTDITQGITLIAPSSTVATKPGTFDFGITVHLQTFTDKTDIPRSSTISLQTSSSPTSSKSSISPIMSPTGSHDNVILTNGPSSVISSLFSSNTFILPPSSVGVNPLHTFIELTFRESPSLNYKNWNTTVEQTNQNELKSSIGYESSIRLLTSMVTSSGDDDSTILTINHVTSSTLLSSFPTPSFNFISSATQQVDDVNLFPASDVPYVDGVQLSTNTNAPIIDNSNSPTKTSSLSAPNVQSSTASAHTVVNADSSPASAHTVVNADSSLASAHTVVNADSSLASAHTVVNLQSSTANAHTVVNVDSSQENAHTLVNVQSSTANAHTVVNADSSAGSAHTVFNVQTSSTITTYNTMTVNTQTVASSQSSTKDLMRPSKSAISTASSIPWNSGTSQPSNEDHAGLEDDSFWPVVAGLVIGIPVLVVLGIAITVIHRKSRQDPSKFFNMKTLNSSSLSSIATARQDISQQSSVDV